MSFFFQAILFGVFCGINPAFGQLKHNIVSYFVGWLWRAVVIFIIAYPSLYLIMPYYAGPFMGLTGLILVFAGLNMIVSFAISAKSADDSDLPYGIIAYILFLLLSIGTAFYGAEMFNAEEYRDLIGKVEVKEFKEDVRPVDVKHIREVSKEQAEVLGGRVLGEVEGAIGSRYAPGEYHIQRINGELYWVAPLEYQGFFKWVNYDYTIGYIEVSAEDNSRKPELVTKDKDGNVYRFKYVNSGFFGDNLKRHIYTHGYMDVALTEFTLEIDDQRKPWYVVSIVEPSITYWGWVVKGVVIVDPQTGEITEYKVGEIPEWVDRVFPEGIVEKRISDWGAYVHGFWNSIFKEEDVIKPVSLSTIESSSDGGTYERSLSPDVFLTWSNNNKPCWFVGLTSSKNTDQSMVGFIMINSRTGKAIKYTTSGVSEDGAIDSVVSALGAEASRWKPVQPILYSVYGKPTWIMPIIDIEKCLFQEIAFVDVSNSKVVRGKSKKETLRLYSDLITAGGKEEVPGMESMLKSITGIVERFGLVNNGMYYFTLFSVKGKIFSGDWKVSDELPLTNKRDKVKVRYLDTDEGVVQIRSFDNLYINTTKSPVSIEFEKQRDKTKKRIKASGDLDNIREKINKMTPEELEKLNEEMNN